MVWLLIDGIEGVTNMVTCEGLIKNIKQSFSYAVRYGYGYGYLMDFGWEVF